MRRSLQVIRLQLVNRQTFVWVPLIVLAGALLISYLIYAIIPGDQPKYGGGSQAPLWYFLFVGIQALTLTFPFSQALSITRRDFFLGTLATAVLTSAAMGAIFVLGGTLEHATGGWGVNGYMFALPWVWEAGPLGAGVVYFALTMMIFMTGFTAATIFKRWNATVLTVVSLLLALVLVGIVYAITRLELWLQVWEGIVHLGALGLALWGLVGVAILATFSFFAFRRAIP